VGSQQQLGAVRPPNEQVVRGSVDRVPANGEPERVASPHQVIHGLMLVVGERCDLHEIDQFPASQVGPSGEITRDTHGWLASLLFTVDRGCRDAGMFSVEG
jgi:hypothetical protein